MSKIMPHYQRERLESSSNRFDRTQVIIFVDFFSEKIQKLLNYKNSKNPKIKSGRLR
jgi:hypothetical protein